MSDIKPHKTQPHPSLIQPAACVYRKSIIALSYKRPFGDVTVAHCLVVKLAPNMSQQQAVGPRSGSWWRSALDVMVEDSGGGVWRWGHKYSIGEQRFTAHRQTATDGHHPPLPSPSLRSSTSSAQGSVSDSGSEPNGGDHC